MRIGQLLSRYSTVLRDLDCLRYALLAFFAVFGIRTAYLIFVGGDFWPSLGILATSVAALSVASNAKQVILRNELERMEDRRRATVKVTHHLMVIVESLINHVHYVKTMIVEQNRPALALVEAVEYISLRYETLLDREVYEYLPGSTIELITKMSGSIFGIKAFANGISQAVSKNPTVLLAGLDGASSGQLGKSIDEWLKNLESLDSSIRKIRNELET